MYEDQKHFLECENQPQGNICICDKIAQEKKDNEDDARIQGYLETI